MPRLIISQIDGCNHGLRLDVMAVTMGGWRQEVRHDWSAPDSHHDRAPSRRRRRRLDCANGRRRRRAGDPGAARRRAARGGSGSGRLRAGAVHMPRGWRLRRRPRERLMGAVAVRTELAPSPLLPEGFGVPPSRWIHPATRFRELLRTEPYLFGPGVYDPMGAQLVMYHRFKAVYFSGYSFAIGHLGTTDMDLYSGPEIADGARRTVSALRKFQLTM